MAEKITGPVKELTPDDLREIESAAQNCKLPAFVTLKSGSTALPGTAARAGVYGKCKSGLSRKRLRPKESAHRLSAPKAWSK